MLGMRWVWDVLENGINSLMIKWKIESCNKTWLKWNFFDIKPFQLTLEIIFSFRLQENSIETKLSK